ncbi:MAG: hypothetical protein KDA93_23780, partial [Planctomycetaceae bacterium]|nr:hypothetical protein [Planctomycetaceae bacterium]
MLSQAFSSDRRRFQSPLSQLFGSLLRGRSRRRSRSKQVQAALTSEVLEQRALLTNLVGIDMGGGTLITGWTQYSSTSDSTLNNLMGESGPTGIDVFIDHDSSPGTNVDFNPPASQLPIHTTSLAGIDRAYSDLGNIEFNFSDLTAGQDYEIYVFAGNDLNGNQKVTITGASSFDFNQPHSVNQLLVNGTTGDSTMQLADYAVVMTADGSGNIKVRVDSSPNPGGFFGVSGIAIQEVAPAMAPVIIDDGDTGFAIESGSWGNGVAGANGDNRNASIWNGDKVASWTFDGLTPGVYRVSATWFPHAVRATDAPFTVFDGMMPLATVDVNQQLSPSGVPGVNDLGRQWEDLGNDLFRITGNTLKVELSNDANGYVIADAVRIERIGELPPPPVIVDDGDPGFAIESGSWGTGNAGAGGDNRNASIFGGPKVASWTFDSLTPGVYRVS